MSQQPKKQNKDKKKASEQSENVPKTETEQPKAQASSESQPTENKVPSEPENSQKQAEAQDGSEASKKNQKPNGVKPHVLKIAAVENGNYTPIFKTRIATANADLKTRVINSRVANAALTKGALARRGPKKASDYFPEEWEEFKRVCKLKEWDEDRAVIMGLKLVKRVPLGTEAKDYFQKIKDASANFDYANRSVYKSYMELEEIALLFKKRVTGQALANYPPIKKWFKSILDSVKSGHNISEYMRDFLTKACWAQADAEYLQLGFALADFTMDFVKELLDTFEYNKEGIAILTEEQIASIAAAVSDKDWFFYDKTKNVITSTEDLSIFSAITKAPAFNISFLFTANFLRSGKLVPEEFKTMCLGLLAKLKALVQRIMEEGTSLDIDQYEDPQSLGRKLNQLRDAADGVKEAISDGDPFDLERAYAKYIAIMSGFVRNVITTTVKQAATEESSEVKVFYKTIAGTIFDGDDFDIPDIEEYESEASEATVPETSS